MKKVIFVILLTTSFLGFTQNDKIKIDIHGGANFSKLRGYEIPEGFNQYYSERPGFAFMGGIGFEKKLAPRLFARLELNYERKRQNSDNIIELRHRAEDYPVEYNYIIRQDFNYLTLPVTLKYFLSEQNKFYFNGGVFLGYLINATAKTDNLPKIENFSDGTNKKDFTDSYKRIDFGATLGFGRNISLSEKHVIFTEIRANIGLLKINNFVAWENGYNKTNSLNLIIGYHLN